MRKTGTKTKENRRDPKDCESPRKTARSWPKRRMRKKEDQRAKKRWRPGRNRRKPPHKRSETQKCLGKQEERAYHKRREGNIMENMKWTLKKRSGTLPAGTRLKRMKDRYPETNEGIEKRKEIKSRTQQERTADKERQHKRTERTRKDRAKARGETQRKAK